ncbi:DNA polymerase IV [Algoriphagus sediminis]|uniref:DNA polymerase IV n=1 Tax=Algoriphagus sediminis TaxID=3057113 RepID=A0ABT7YD46_9BACT|nr:DNA polymerase IV [Algoriphagus sediminis]MDN3204444.1 DNA polymerase IV [Algoriphagus sediminis]
MEDNRSIAHMDLDTFFVSCERLIDSRLVGKPVMVGGTSDRGVVAACSYEARKYGVHSAMPMKLAKRLCPEGIILRGNTGIYTKYSNMVTDIIKEEVPLYEKSSVDEFYIDLTGMDRFFGCYKMVSELRDRIIKETGLPISFGLSINKTVSKIATGEAKPNNKIHIQRGTEKGFLSPLSVKKIPMVGNKTYQSLCDFGMKRIQNIQQMPVKVMGKVFGKNGISIWKKANGIDLSPVIAYQERKSISTERSFDQDTTDVVRLKSIITAMAENLIFQLRRGNKLTACVTVKIRYSDFTTYTQQRKVPYSASDHLLLPVVMDLYDKLYNRRLLVRMVGVRFSHLVEGGHQINLFDDKPELIQLYNAMDYLRDKFGDRAVLRASGFGAKTIGRFNPFTGEAPPLLANRRE